MNVEGYNNHSCLFAFTICDVTSLQRKMADACSYVFLLFLFFFIYKFIKALPACTVLFTAEYFFPLSLLVITS